MRKNIFILLVALSMGHLSLGAAEELDKFKQNCDEMGDAFGWKIISDRELSKINCQASYSSGLFNLETGAYKKSLTDNDYDAHIEYWGHLYNLATLYAYVETREGKEKVSENDLGEVKYRDLVFKSVKWYFGNNKECSEHEYHKTYTYHPVKSTPTVIPLIAEIGTLLHKDFHTLKESNADVKYAFDKLTDYGSYILDSGEQQRGANWSYRSKHCLRFVYFSNSSAMLDKYKSAIDRSFEFELDDFEQRDGMYPDFSFRHHGDMNFWGMYGYSYMREMLDLAAILDGTAWAFSSEKYSFMAEAYLEGLRYCLYRGNIEYSTAPKRASALLERVDRVPGHVAEDLQHLLDLGGNFNRRAEIEDWLENLDRTYVDSYADKSLSEITGHKYYWYTEYQTHRRPDYSIAVRRSSQRVRGPEDSAISDIKCHLHYGSGYTSLLIHNDEYRIARLGWNWNALPGTTLEQNGIVNSGKAGSKKRGRNMFSGGVAEGNLGCGGFQLDLAEYDNGQWNSINNARANKGNFFFEEGMLCLGSNIYSESYSSNEIWTCINQLRNETDVYYSIDGNEMQKVSKRSMQNITLSINNKAWFWHHDMAYVLYASEGKTVSVNLDIEQRELHPVLNKEDEYMQGLSSSEQSDGKIWMFQLTINHGRNPNHDSYQYVVLPNFSKEEAENYCNSPNYKVLKNNDRAQLIWHNDNIYQGVFYESGDVEFEGGASIETPVPMIFQIRNTRDGKSIFCANNPNPKDRTPDFFVSQNFIGTTYESPQTVSLKGLNGVEDQEVLVQFETERGYEGKTVSQEIKSVATSADYIQSETFRIWKNNKELYFGWNRVGDVQLFDVSGKCILYKKNIDNKLSLHSVKPGVYIVKTEKITQKIVL